uniref:Uncharacterized protein n=1 Tax=Tetradesmus obliquus TaxID=3088 RepID=A0A383VDK2_TETOB
MAEEYGRGGWQKQKMASCRQAAACGSVATVDLFTRSCTGAAACRGDPTAVVFEGLCCQWPSSAPARAHLPQPQQQQQQQQQAIGTCDWNQAVAQLPDAEQQQQQQQQQQQAYLTSSLAHSDMAAATKLLARQPQQPGQPPSWLGRVACKLFSCGVGSSLSRVDWL